MNLTQFKEIYKKDNLRFFELLLLSLFIISLPSFEAPKNIFLAMFFGISLMNCPSFSSIKKSWGLIDSIFLVLIASSTLSAIFSGLKGFEWTVLPGMYTWILLGWLISKKRFSAIEIKWILSCLLISAIPPAVWGIYKVLLFQSETGLQLHSVGHQNHSALYLLVVNSLAVSSIGVIFKKRYNLGLLISVLFAVSIILTQSRAAFLSMCILNFFTYFWINETRIKGLFSSFIIIILCTFFLEATVLKKNLEYIKNDNLLSGRKEIWIVAEKACLINPFLGIGNGNWKLLTPEVLSKVSSEKTIKYSTASHGHNLFLSWLVERGFLGIVILLTLMFVWIRLIVLNYK